ncbi:MAG: hypothetical protein DME50_10650 [Verrucomicrobia bacterium]|nr:MAG: hypothetical protein DME50_10650 [Verrucomicrobiota bacterium]
MNEEPRVTTSFWPPRNTEIAGAEQRGVSEALGREAAQREMAKIRAMNPPPWRRSRRPPIREAELSADFATRIAKLDQEIVERGVAVDRSKLLMLGKSRFAELLAADREARGIQRVFRPRNDFSRWSSVQLAFARVGALESSIRARSNSEILAGAGVDREAAREIVGLQDLWKSIGYPPSIKALYNFHDRFASLIFGRSLLERIGDDNRVHSNFFCGGSQRKVLLFREWIRTLRGPILSISLRDPLWTLIAWMAGDKSPAPDASELAKEIFGVRAPNAEALRFSSR